MKDKELHQKMVETSRVIAAVFDEYKARHAKELGYINYHFENGKLVPDAE